MKLTELIKALQEHLDVFGDKDICLAMGYYEYYEGDSYMEEAQSQKIGVCHRYERDTLYITGFDGE